MADQSAIAWTNSTANFWMGCEKVSPGCAHCYAETLTKNRMGLRVWGPNSRRQEVKSIWSKLKKWDREAAAALERRRVFVMSLGDFLEDHPDADVIRPRAWDAMRATEWLDYQVLTKRPENYTHFLPPGFADRPWPHIWGGTSVENRRFLWRIDELRRQPFAVRFLSVEPLLGDLGDVDLTGIHWVIVGGESGPGYRPMDHAWARALRDQCVDNGVAFFMKQSAAPRTEMGTYLVEADGTKWKWQQYPRTPFNPEGTFTQPERIAA